MTVRSHEHQWVEREGVSWGVRIRYVHCYICGKILTSGSAP